MCLVAVRWERQSSLVSDRPKGRSFGISFLIRDLYLGRSIFHLLIFRFVKAFIGIIKYVGNYFGSAINQSDPIQ